MTEPISMSPWNATVLTLYPDMFPGPLAGSLVGKAQESGLWSLETVDIRSFARDKHRSVDDTPAGGGPGMVMRADILGQAVDHVLAQTAENQPLIYLSPRGAPLDQQRVRSLASGPGVSLLCGRFEGIDERVLEARPIIEVSLGDFVLSGGEIAAMALIDATVRLLPGVIGSEASTEEESFENHLLEYPHYTRPATWDGLNIPDVLTSGHHRRIEEWRQKQMIDLTKDRRPDLWEKYKLGKDE
jgi:tRNA (guanine37-N1)-methyltransferase